MEKTSTAVGPKLVVAVTGASGAIYAVRFLKQAAPLCERIDVILSEAALTVYATEIGGPLKKPYTSEQLIGEHQSSIRFCGVKDYFTPPASGSYRHDGMVIIPCSMGTAGRIASGVSDDLISRAADVCLKERRKLILVPREAPFNLIHLRNLTTLTEAGATILPASPSFYSNPKSIEDLVDTVVARVMQNIGLTQSIARQWQEE